MTELLQTLTSEQTPPLVLQYEKVVPTNSNFQPTDFEQELFDLSENNHRSRKRTYFPRFLNSEEDIRNHQPLMRGIIVHRRDRIEEKRQN